MLKSFFYLFEVFSTAYLHLSTLLVHQKSHSQKINNFQDLLNQLLVLYLNTPVIHPYNKKIPKIFPRTNCVKFKLNPISDMLGRYKNIFHNLRCYNLISLRRLEAHVFFVSDTLLTQKYTCSKSLYVKQRNKIFLPKHHGNKKIIPFYSTRKTNTFQMTKQFAF